MNLRIFKLLATDVAIDPNRKSSFIYAQPFKHQQDK